MLKKLIGNPEFERRVRELHGKGLGDKRIAEILGCNRDTIRKVREKLGLKSHFNPITKEEIEQIKELHAKGLSDSEIARAIGRNRVTVRKVRERLGLKSNFKKIGEKELQIIRDLNQAGFNDYEIAGILGVNPVTVRAHRKKMGLPAIGYTCCTMMNRVKQPSLKKKVEKCAKASMEFLHSYMKRITEEVDAE